VSNDLEYITSERFIHDDLLRKAQEYIDVAASTWEEDGKLEGFAFSWPAIELRGDDGSRLGLVVMKMPEADTTRALQKFVERTQSYGLLVIEQKEKEIVGAFETHHGSRVWRIPILRKGDRWGLGDQKVSDNAGALGILWSPKRGTS